MFHIRTIAKALEYDRFDSLRPQQVQSVLVDDVKRLKMSYTDEDWKTVDQFFTELQLLLERLTKNLQPTGGNNATALPEGPTGIIDEAIDEAEADVVEGNRLLANIAGSTAEVTEKGKRRKNTKGKRKKY